MANDVSKISVILPDFKCPRGLKGGSWVSGCPPIFGLGDSERSKFNVEEKQ